MKKQTILTLIVAMLVSVPVSTKAQLTPQEAIVQMGRGINLGNTLEPPDEGDWAPAAKEMYFDKYVEAGFKTVRIPVSWYGHTDIIPPYTIDSIWMARVEEIVDWGLDRDLFIVLNAHHEHWLKQEPTAENLERFDSMWSQIATHFKDKPERLLFEMINEPEPMPKATVDDLNERILSIIRITNPTRIVLFSGESYSNSNHLITANIPNDTLLIGYFHSYDPWPFAGEGEGTWGTTADRNAVENKYTSVSAWSETNDIPVFLGEFGARVECDFNSRMYYYSVVVEKMVDHGFASAAWDDGGWWKNIDRNTGSWSEVKDILINYTSSNPTLLSLQQTNEFELTLGWTNRTSDNDSIFIERGTTATNLTRVAILESDVTIYIDTAITHGRFYYYRVVAGFNDTTSLLSYPIRFKPATLTSIEQRADVENSVFIYPNPTAGQSLISVTAPEAISDLVIYSVHGKIIQKLKPGSKQYQLDISQLTRGIYLVETHFGDTKNLGKMVVE